MKTERVVLLTTPDFKAFLAREARKEGISVAELVRNRCEGRASGNEAELVRATAELRTAVTRARAALKDGLSEAQAALTELKQTRSNSEARKKATTREHA